MARWTISRLRRRLATLDLLVQAVTIALIPYWVCAAFGALLIDMVLAFCQVPIVLHERVICLAGLLASASVVVMSAVMLLNAVAGAYGSLFSRLRRASFALTFGYAFALGAFAVYDALCKLFAGNPL